MSERVQDLVLSHWWSEHFWKLSCRFPERGCALEHQICRFAKMILRDRCSTSYDLASLFHGSGSTSDRWGGNITKRIGARPSARHPICNFAESPQNCFVFNVVNVEFLRMSCRLASFWSCEVSFFEEVSQNCFLTDRWMDGCMDG